MNNHIPYYSLSIHPNQINVFYQSTNGRRPPCNYDIDDETDNKTVVKQPTQFKDNFHQGRISPIAKRKMSRALEYLIYMAKPKHVRNPFNGKYFTFRVNFITLTLSAPQIHSDQEIKSQLLNQFLIEMTRRWNVGRNVWRAEKQANGRIHFHIVTDKFIPLNELRNVWNRIQQKLGYVTRYREDRLEYHKHGFKFDKEDGRNRLYKEQFNAYKVGNQTGWDNPNSIDIHSLKYIRNIKSYMVKYMSKNEQYSEKEKVEYNALPEEEKAMIRDKMGVSGRLWSCSSNLTNLKGGECDCDSFIYEELERIAQDNEDCRYDSDYFHVYTVDINTLTRLNCRSLLSVFEDFIRLRFPDDYLKVIN